VPLKIQRTGLAQYAPGGDARVKMLVVGGPDTGKTRMSTYWPKPIIANCEAGLASVADRGVPFVDIKNSRDMLEFLSDLEKVCMRAWADREFQTVVIDTADTFQRKVKDEYMQAHPEMQSFRGFDAWGYLDSKMQALFTRLLNLDMNIIVNVHYKDKTIREGTGENATERQELMLQLSGDIKDSIFNDFDLVGWLGTYYAPGATADEPRVEKRGLTFKKSPDRPFLKDRLGVTPPWMEVTFSEDDYYNLFLKIVERLDAIPETEDVRELEPLPTQMAGNVVGPLAGGAVAPQDPASMPLEQLDKPSLQTKCREWAAKAEQAGHVDVVGLLKFASNDTKPVLVEKLKQARKILEERAAAKAAGADAVPAEATETPAAEVPQEVPAEAAEPVAPVASATTAEPAAETPAEPTTAPVAEVPAEPTPAEPAVAPETPVAPESAPAPAAEPAPATEPVVATPEPATAAAPAPETPVAAPAPTTAPTETVTTVEGQEQVDTATGELPTVAPEEGVANAAAALGGEVVSETPAVEAPQDEPPAETPAPPAQAAPAAPAVAAPASGGSAGGREIPAICQRLDCTTELAGENQDYVKISFVKFRNFFCNKDFTEAKTAGKVPWPVKESA
jgi:hypothetical protein